MKMKDIRTKSENTTPRQRAAARIPKEAMRQLWLRSKEKGRTEIESTADGQQGGQYSEANQTGEKVSDALQSVGKSSAKVAVHKGRELAKKRAGQRHMEQSVERQEQTGQQSFSELQAPDGGQVSSNLTEPRECSVPSGKENPSANHSRISDSAKQTSDRNIKSNRLSVKEKPHDIKTAPHEIRGVSRDRPADRRNQLPRWHRHCRARRHTNPCRRGRNSHGGQRPRQLGRQLRLLCPDRPRQRPANPLCPLLPGLRHPRPAGTGRAGDRLRRPHRPRHGQPPAF